MKTKKVLRMICAFALCFAIAASGAVFGFASSNAGLSSLSLGDIVFTPEFSSDITAYSANVPYSTVSVTVTPAAADNGVVTVKDIAITGITPFVTVELSEGENTIPVVVTSEDGSATKTYTITVTRQAAEDSADLSGLSLSSGTLYPEFSSDVTEYKANVENAVESITVTPTAEQPTATVKIGDAVIEAGSSSLPLALNEGENLIAVNVTAQNGNIKVYNITVTREKPADFTDADLTSITLSCGNLAPDFIREVTSYTAAVPSDTEQVEITPTAANTNAVITVNGVGLVDGKANISLAEDKTDAAIVVTLGEVTKTYSITITKQPEETSTAGSVDLKSINLAHIKLKDNPNMTDFTVSVPYAREKIMLIPKAVDKNAVITINGAPFTTRNTNGGNVRLNVGENKVLIVVTNGDASKTYTVTIIREENKKSDKSVKDNNHGKNGAQPAAPGKSAKSHQSGKAQHQNSKKK
ncbi:MAG: cadherin-like beta sandwich domain-containing protein [Bacillota bacterium]|nr:cadherin-like beta sandwich domain-containing protein [Bacillota bacterium]